MFFLLILVITGMTGILVLAGTKVGLKDITLSMVVLLTKIIIREAHGTHLIEVDTGLMSLIHLTSILIPM